MSMLQKIGRLLTGESLGTPEKTGSTPAGGLRGAERQPTAQNAPSLQEIVEVAKGSVRLRNCLKNSEFPFKTVTEYQAHKSPIEAVISVQNAGKGTAAELDAIIKNFLADPEKYSFVRQVNERIDIKDNILQETWKIFEGYQFPDFIFSLSISMRLENVLRGVKEDKENPFPTLTDCLLKNHKLEPYFLSRSAMGRKTLSELRDLIKVVYNHILDKSGLLDAEKALLTFWIFPEKEKTDQPDIDQAALLEKLKSINSHGQNSSIEDSLLIEARAGIVNLNTAEKLDDGAISDLMKAIIKDREYDILTRRFGFGHKRPETLEEIACTYGCTRERIRQIEKKSLRKISPLKKVFLKVLQDGAKDIEVSLFESAEYFSAADQARQFKLLAGKYQISIEAVYKGFEVYLKTTCTKYKGFWIKASIDQEKLATLQEMIDSGSASRPIEKRIIEALQTSGWPIQIQSLEKALPELSAAVIKNTLTNDLGATIEDGKIFIPADKLRSSLRLVLVLRYAGRAISLAEARYFHNQMFGTDMNEHVIGAVFGRLEEALIVERGKYALYETISLSAEDVRAVRQRCWKYLSERQVYTSTKRIFDELFIGHHDYGAEFNPYMVLGILQDDKRFVCKRGLMLGLSTFSEEDFIGLNDQIYKIVEDYGPIDLKKIQEHLSHHRKVLDVSVLVVLEDSQNYIKVAPSTFDSIARVIGDEKDCAKLRDALEIALIDGDLTTFTLQSRVEAVGFSIDKHILISWLDKQENIDRHKTIVHLASPSPEVAEYNKKYLHLKKTCSSSEFHTEAMCNALMADSPFMAALDYRLTDKALETGRKPDEKDELDSLFKEFEF